MADDAQKFASELSDAVGRAEVDVKNGLASFMSFAKGLNLGQEEAAKMAKELQAASVDFASFNNMSDGEAQQRFISAMSGSSEVLDMFGINLKQSALDLELQNSGLAESAVKATEAQKAMARYNIIIKTMTRQGALGDAVRTADSYANTLKRLQAEVKEAGTILGEMLVPVAAKVVSGFIAAARAVRKFFDWLRPKDLDDTIEKLKELGAAGEDIARLERAQAINEATEQYQELLQKVNKSTWDQESALAAVENQTNENIDATLEVGRLQNQLAKTEKEFEELQKTRILETQQLHGLQSLMTDEERERYLFLKDQRAELSAQLREAKSISGEAGKTTASAQEYLQNLKLLQSTEKRLNSLKEQSTEEEEEQNDIQQDTNDSLETEIQKQKTLHDIISEITQKKKEQQVVDQARAIVEQREQRGTFLFEPEVVEPELPPDAIVDEELAAQSRYEEIVEHWPMLFEKKREMFGETLKSLDEYTDEEKRKFDAMEQQHRMFVDRMASVYADLGASTVSALVQGMMAGEDAMRENFKKVLNMAIDFVEREFIIAKASTIIKGIMSGGTSLIKELPGLAVAFAALEGARYAVNAYQAGIGFVPNEQMAMVHGGERILSNTDNRALLDRLSQVESKLESNQGGGNSYTIYAMDSQSFESWLRRGGNAVLQKQVDNGHLFL